jgi:hypothetical protein
MGQALFRAVWPPGLVIDLVLVVGAGEATHVEPRHIMMLLCLIRSHGRSSFSMRYL